MNVDSLGVAMAEIVPFWQEAGAAKWFTADPVFDDLVRAKFENAHQIASRGEFGPWEDSAEGVLALILLLDQIPRNIYRRSAHAFATDPLARAIAIRALARGMDQQIQPDLRAFAYLPFEHHEDSASQTLSFSLFTKLVAVTGGKETLRFAELHADLISRFGRFPHRNQVLGRSSTPEEIQYLASGGFAG